MVAILTANALVVRLVNMVTIVTSNVEMTAFLDVIRTVGSVLALLGTMVKYVIKSAVRDVISQYVRRSLDSAYMDVRLVFGCSHTVIDLVQRTARRVCVMLHHHIALLAVYLVFMERHVHHLVVPHALITYVNEAQQNVLQDA